VVIAGFDPLGPQEYWRWKRQQLPICPIPWDFPWREQLAEAGYVGIEDLRGATAEEIANVNCISESDGESILQGLFGEDYEPMGFFREGRYYDVRTVSVQPTISVTGTGESAVLYLGDRATLRLDLLVADLPVDENVAVELFTRRDIDDPWRSLGSYYAYVDGSERKCFIGLDREVKAVWIASLTATLALTGEAA
jgi:hypothetical protein